MSSWATHAVVLPGTGSDGRFASDAFSPALAAVGTITEAVEPDPTGVVASYESALDSAADEHGCIVVGGISIGAAVAVAWASRNPDRVVAVLAALPPWIGCADDAPAALSARYTAQCLVDDGLDATIRVMTASTPSWLAQTLTRSWTSQWPQLPSALLEAANYVAPELQSLALLQIPTAIVAAVDDPIHPLEIADIWHANIRISTLSTVTLADIGADPGVIGVQAVDSLAGIVGS